MHRNWPFDYAHFATFATGGTARAHFSTVQEAITYARTRPEIGRIEQRDNEGDRIKTYRMFGPRIAPNEVQEVIDHANR